VIDATLMENVDAFSVLVCGVLIVKVLYPALQRRGIHLGTTHKFALGTFCLVLACACQLIIEYQIHSKYTNENQQISVLWQSFPYIFVWAGEIFALSSAFDSAFKVAPKERKVFATAIALTLMGGIPNFVWMAIRPSVKQWPNSYNRSLLNNLSSKLRVAPDWHWNVRLHHQPASMCQELGGLC